MKDRQAGFGIVEAVVVVLAVGVLASAGWFVYQHNRTKVTNAAVGSQQPTPAPTTATATTVVKLPELNIQITVPTDMQDLTYQVKTLTLRGGVQSTTAFFSTAALTAADPNCGPSAAPLGTLGMTAGQYPTASQDPYAALDYGRLVKQFPTFYIAAGSPNGSCSTSASLPKPASGSWKSEFGTATSTIQQLSAGTTN